MTDEVQPEDTAVDELFESEGHPEIATEVEAKAEPEVAKEDVTTEGETEEAASEIASEESETAPPAVREATLVPIAALHDERRKAHQLKEEVENLRQQLPKNEEAPDPYEDIDAYTAYKKAEWVRESQAEQGLKNSQRIDSLRGQMLESHDDFLEMENIFGIMQARDPSLMDKMLQSGNEVEFAYSTAKAYKTALLGGAVVEKEPELSVAELRNKSAVEMPNLAKATAQASNTVQLEKEADIDDIFENQKY